MTKGKKDSVCRKKGEPSIEVCKELALLYIQKLRKKGIEPSVKSIANEYLLSEEMVRELLAKEVPESDYDNIVSPRD
jgi:hypothetical protein